MVGTISCSSCGIWRCRKLRCKLCCLAGTQQLACRRAAEVWREQGRQGLQAQMSCCCSGEAPRKLPGSKH